MIRQLVRADILDVQAIDKDLFVHPFSRKSLARLTDHPSTSSFVFEVENNVVGYIISSSDMFTSEIVRLGVMRQFQGFGYARALINRLTQHVGPDMSVEFMAPNEEMAFFAQRCDFHVVAHCDGKFLFRRGWRMGTVPQIQYRLTRKFKNGLP